MAPARKTAVKKVAAPEGVARQPRAKKQKTDEEEPREEGTDAGKPDSKGLSSAASALGLAGSQPLPEGDVDAVKKTDMATFVTLAKSPNNPDTLAADEKYRTASRFDDTKKQIVALWKSDRDCKWWNSWNQADTQEDTVAHEDLSGYGTRRVLLHVNTLCFFHVCVVPELNLAGMKLLTCCTCLMTILLWIPF